MTVEERDAALAVALLREAQLLHVAPPGYNHSMLVTPFVCHLCGELYTSNDPKTRTGWLKHNTYRVGFTDSGLYYVYCNGTPTNVPYEVP